MNDAHLHTLDQLRAFLKGTVAVGFSVDANERYDFITRTLRRANKGVVFGACERLRSWVGWYNRERPHQGLGYCTPDETYSGELEPLSEVA